MVSRFVMSPCRNSPSSGSKSYRSYIAPLDKQRMTRRYTKMYFFFFSTAMIVCSSNTVRHSSHISFFCGGDPYCTVVQRPENTHEELKGLFERPASLYLQSKITDLILSFQVPCGSINIHIASRVFLFVAGYLNLHTSVFFRLFVDLICEISVILSIGNKSY